MSESEKIWHRYLLRESIYPEGYDSALQSWVGILVETFSVEQVDLIVHQMKAINGIAQQFHVPPQQVLQSIIGIMEGMPITDGDYNSPKPTFDFKNNAKLPLHGSQPYNTLEREDGDEYAGSGIGG